MKSNFANDVRKVETQSQTVVENWRAQEGARIRTVYRLPDSTVKSVGEREEWRHFSRHIEIAVADGLPFFALVESERVTDSLGRELRRASPRIVSVSDKGFEIVRDGYLRLDGDRVAERLDRVMERLRLAGSRLENDPDVLTKITEGLTLSPAGRMRFKADAHAFAEGRLGAGEFVRRTVESQDGYTVAMTVGRTMAEKTDTV
jgi:hypothetical protein